MRRSACSSRWSVRFTRSPPMRWWARSRRIWWRPKRGFDRKHRVAKNGGRTSRLSASKSNKKETTTKTGVGRSRLLLSLRVGSDELLADRAEDLLICKRGQIDQMLAIFATV